MPTIVRRIVAVAVAGLLISTGVAFAAKSGLFEGATSQKLGGTAFRISLNVSGGAVTNVQLTAAVTQGGGLCPINGQGGPLLVFSKGKAKIHHGKFDGKLRSSEGASLAIKGHIGPHAITGSFIVDSTFGIHGAPTCTSGKVTFTARASGGQVHGTKYSGTIPPGFPINFRVSANGTAVDGLVVAFEDTACLGGGAGPGPAPKFHFKTLQIKSGSFSGTVTRHFGSGASDLVRVSGTFFGRVAAGQVSDTQRITGVLTCTDTGDFTVKAR
jgi:hypothetical protein